MGAKSLTSLGRVWKISKSSVSGFPQGLLVGEPSTDALQEEMLSALPTLGKTDFIYTAMEKGLNMWNSMDQRGGHSAQSRQEHKHPEEKNVLVTGRVNISAELICTSMSHRGGFRRASIQARSNFICQLKWFSGTQTFRRRKMWRAGNDTWVSNTALWAGAEGAEILQLCLLPKELPQEKMPGQV